MITDPDYRDDATVRHPPPQQPATARDSHPSLAQRLAALDRLPDIASDHDVPPPLDLVPDPEDLFRGDQHRNWIPSPRPMPWQDWVIAIADQHAAEELGELRTAVNLVGGTKAATLTVGAVLDLLEAGHQSRLASALAGSRSESVLASDDPPLHAAVFTLVGQALVDAGSAAWTVPWTGTRHLVPSDGTPEELHDLVRAAVDRPTEVSRLRLHLAASDVDVEDPVALPTDPPTTDDEFDATNSELLDEQRGHLGLVVTATVLVLVVAGMAAFSDSDEEPPGYRPGLTTISPWLPYVDPPVPPRPPVEVPKPYPVPPLPEVPYVPVAPATP
jgi:hypothetical protein